MKMIGDFQCQKMFTADRGRLIEVSAVPSRVRIFGAIPFRHLLHLDLGSQGMWRKLICKSCKWNDVAMFNLKHRISAMTSTASMWEGLNTIPFSVVGVLRLAWRINTSYGTESFEWQIPSLEFPDLKIALHRGFLLARRQANCCWTEKWG